MTPEVLELVEKLYRTHKTKDAVRKLFVSRAADEEFSFIGYAAAEARSEPLVNHQDAVWYGYEIAVEKVEMEVAV